MPSTYTLNNGIELIATGEQSGTWGDTTNTNFNLVDTALDGQVTITLASAGTSGSPNTLAISDGAASNGRNRLVIYTDGGDLGATAYVQLTPNDAEKIVYIRNNLSGSRSIIVFQGTYNASNDYEIPAGTTAVIFFNGGGAGAVAANVFNNAYFDGLRLGAVSVTAILDEDNMASDSATALATQQSIKAYVDAQVAANNELSEVLANGNTSGGNNIQMTTTDEVQFRDTALKISSSADGQLDIDADVEVEIVAPTLDIDASTAVTIDTATLTMTGSVNVVGDLDVDNLNLNGNSIISTNANGNIALTPNGTGEVDISKVDIDGGTIDGTTIGGTTPAAITGTTLTATTSATLQHSSSTKLATTPTGVDVTGTVTADGLTVDGAASIDGASGIPLTLDVDAGANTNLQFNEGSALRWYLRSVTVSNDFNFYGNGGSRLNISSGGDIQFYEDTGTTPKFFWDASAEALGIGTTSPDAPLSFAGATGQKVQFYDGTQGYSIGVEASEFRFVTDASGVFTFKNGSTYSTAAEYMRIDASGNLGLGVTPSAWASTFKTLQVGATASLVGFNSEYMWLASNWSADAGVDRYITSAPATIYRQHNGGHAWFTAPSGTAGNAITFTQAMTLSAAGGLSIGTTTDAGAGNLRVNGGALIGDGTASAPTITFYNESNTGIFRAGASVLGFTTAGSERMRIDSSGNLLVGNSTAPQISAGSTGRISSIAASASDVAFAASLPASATGTAIRAQSVTAAGTGWKYFTGSSGNGSTLTTNNIFIYGNGDIENTNNSYGAISDAKLKENIVDASPKLADLMQVKVRNYNLKGEYEQHKQIGVVAQELEQIFPGMVHDLPDRDAEGNDLGTTTKSVKYSVFVPMLIKAMQEQQTIIEALEARITALEA